MYRQIQRIRSRLPSRYKCLIFYYRLTALGVIIHELAHEMFARQRGLGVIEVEYFTLKSDQLGYVVHEAPRTYTDLFLVSVAPFILNTIVGLTAFISVGLYIGWANFLPPTLYSIVGAVGIVLLCWAGVSATQHAFPSITDVGNIYEGTAYLWGKSVVPVIQPLTLFAMKRHWIVYVGLYPIWMVLRALQALIFVIKHPFAVLTMPAVAVLDILNRTTKYGSNTAYSVGVAILSYHATTILDQPVETLIRLLV